MSPVCGQDRQVDIDSLSLPFFGQFRSRVKMMIHRFSVVFLVVSLSPFGAPAAEPTALPLGTLSPQTDLQATKSRQATYRVDFRVAVNPPAGTKRLRVWLPLPPSDQCQTISERRLDTFPRSIEPTIESEPEFGNSFAYFEFDSPQGAQLIQHQFTAEIHQLDWDVDYGLVARPDVWPKSFTPYQRPDPRSGEGNELREVLSQIDASNRSDADGDRLVGAIQWVDQNLTYDHANASLSADPMHAMVNRRGHCSDYHGLCGTLAREIGYPSRVLYGLHMFDKGSPSHCKLDVFLPPYGWVSYDLSETQKLAIKTGGDQALTSEERESQVVAIKDRTLRGFRENTWLLVTRGVNYELAPPAAKRVAIVRTIYAEADGVALKEPGSDPNNHDTVAWMTMHRVDEQGSASKRFQVLEAP